MTVVDIPENKDPYQYYSTEFIYHRNKDKGKNKYKKIISSVVVLIIGYGFGIITCKLSNFCALVTPFSSSISLTFASPSIASISSF